MSAALSAVDARRVTETALFGLRDDIAPPVKARVVAAGKAAWGMAEAVMAVFGDRVTAGIITTGRTRDDVAAALGRQWRAFDAGHPVPTAQSEAAGRAALSLAGDAARNRERLVVCLSGGASAMLAVPAAGLTIEDKARATAALLGAGASIDEMNLVRRHLSGIKGGQLARALRGPIDHARDFRRVRAERRRPVGDRIGPDDRRGVRSRRGARGAPPATGCRSAVRS